MASDGQHISTPACVDMKGRNLWRRFLTPDGEVKEADMTVVDWQGKGWEMMGTTTPTPQDEMDSTRHTIDPKERRSVTSGPAEANRVGGRSPRR